MFVTNLANGMPKIEFNEVVEVVRPHLVTLLKLLYQEVFKCSCKARFYSIVSGIEGELYDSANYPNKLVSKILNSTALESQWRSGINVTQGDSKLKVKLNKYDEFTIDGKELSSYCTYIYERYLSKIDLGRMVDHAFYKGYYLHMQMYSLVEKFGEEKAKDELRKKFKGDLYYLNGNKDSPYAFFNEEEAIFHLTESLKPVRSMLLSIVPLNALDETMMYHIEYLHPLSLGQMYLISTFLETAIKHLLLDFEDLKFGLPLLVEKLLTWKSNVVSQMDNFVQDEKISQKIMNCMSKTATMVVDSDGTKKLDDTLTCYENIFNPSQDPAHNIIRHANFEIIPAFIGNLVDSYKVSFIAAYAKFPLNINIKSIDKLVGDFKKISREDNGSNGDLEFYVNNDHAVFEGSLDSTVGLYEILIDSIRNSENE